MFIKVINYNINCGNIYIQMFEDVYQSNDELQNKWTKLNMDEILLFL